MSIEGLKPQTELPAWSVETATDRLNRCRVMLKVHGFLSDAESARVMKRIDKWLTKSRKRASDTKVQP